jgi:hypothetical protein
VPERLFHVLEAGEQRLHGKCEQLRQGMARCTTHALRALHHVRLLHAQRRIHLGHLALQVGAALLGGAHLLLGLCQLCVDGVLQRQPQLLDGGGERLGGRAEAGMQLRQRRRRRRQQGAERRGVHGVAGQTRPGECGEEVGAYAPVGGGL